MLPSIHKGAGMPHRQFSFIKVREVQATPVIKIVHPVGAVGVVHKNVGIAVVHAAFVWPVLPVIKFPRVYGVRIIHAWIIDVKRMARLMHEHAPIYYASVNKKELFAFFLNIFAGNLELIPPYRISIESCIIDHKAVVEYAPSPLIFPIVQKILFVIVFLQCSSAQLSHKGDYLAPSHASIIQMVYDIVLIVGSAQYLL